METVALWGCGEFGKKTYDILQKYGKGKYEVKYWCDSNPEKVGETIEGLLVLSPSDLKKKCEEKAVDFVIISVNIPLINEIIAALKENRIMRAALVPQGWYTGRMDCSKLELVHFIDTNKPILEYYEYHICDHCNLNCKGCGHVSNICEEYFADLDQYISDLKQLRKLFSACSRIKLLGGEPLLNPELPKFVEATSNYFPESELYIGTNGLLIPRIGDELLDCMRANGVFFMISAYPPVQKMKEKIEERCKAFGVKYVFTKEITEFNTRLHLDAEFDCRDSYNMCKSMMGGVQCFTLREGVISPCVTFYFRMLKEKFDLDYEITDRDEFDLYKYTDGWELSRLLHQPIPFCAHCGGVRFFPWQTSSKNEVSLEDYIV